jgi:hypothetical protein
MGGSREENCGLRLAQGQKHETFSEKQLKLKGLVLGLRLKVEFSRP